MIIQIISNFLEAYLFSYFVKCYFSINNAYYIVSLIIQFITLNLATIYNNNGTSLTLLIIIINILTVSLFKKKIAFKIIFVVIFYNFLIVFTSIFSLAVINFLYLKKMIFFTEKTNIILAIILSKVILIFITYQFFSLKIKINISLSLKQWKSLIIYLLFILLTITFLSYKIVLNKVDILNLYILLSLQAIQFLFLVIIIIRISNLNKQNIKLMQLNQINEFNKQSNYSITNIKYEIEEIEHRLFYILYQLEYHIHKSELIQAQKVITKYRHFLTKHCIYINTNNTVFDYILSSKINEFIYKDIDVHIFISINKRNIYNNLEFINDFIKVLSCFRTCKYIHIMLTEQNNYLTIKIVYDENTSLCQIIDKSLKTYCRKYEGLFNKDYDKIKTIKCAINLQDTQL